MCVSTLNQVPCSEGLLLRQFESANGGPRLAVNVPHHASVEENYLHHLVLFDFGGPSCEPVGLTTSDSISHRLN